MFGYIYKYLKRSSFKENEYKYQFLNRRKICSNSKFNVFFDHVISPDKKDINDFLIVKPKISIRDKIVGVCVIPIFEDKFCLMNGWRHQFDQFIMQAPAGFVEEGEDPSLTALRELREETSFVCSKKHLISLGSYLPDAGLIEGRVALFLAAKCKKSNDIEDYEIGSSSESYFTKLQIKNILFKESNIGGSTIVACHRALVYLGAI